MILILRPLQRCFACIILCVDVRTTLNEESCNLNIIEQCRIMKWGHVVIIFDVEISTFVNEEISRVNVFHCMQRRKSFSILGVNISAIIEQ